VIDDKKHELRRVIALGLVVLAVVTFLFLNFLDVLNLVEVEPSWFGILFGSLAMIGSASVMLAGRRSNIDNENTQP
jgi:hypothetical protein